MSLTGYHGTTISNALLIVKEGFKSSGNKAWFGDGVYFFETIRPLTDGLKDAKDWCKKVKHFTEYSIIKAEIKESLSCIDLVSNEGHLEQFNELRKVLFQIHTAAGNDASDFTDRQVFVFMVKSQVQKSEPVDYIRAVVDARKFPGYISYTIGRPQIQICVKNRELIYDKKIILSEKKI